MINNIDITHVDNYSLRKIVGVDPQNVDLFKGTIAGNIALGDFEPDMNRIIQISMKVGIQKIIDKLPQGIYTDVGENGLALSGGERQKIAFARVLYRNPEIIILDEATSAMDSESEEQIMEVVRELKSEGKTVIMIAHRLSSVLNADKIVVMADGEVVESGTHEELFKRKQKYYSLWQKQMPKLT